MKAIRVIAIAKILIFLELAVSVANYIPVYSQAYTKYYGEVTSGVLGALMAIIIEMSLFVFLYRVSEKRHRFMWLWIIPIVLIVYYQHYLFYSNSFTGAKLYLFPGIFPVIIVLLLFSSREQAKENIPEKQKEKQVVYRARKPGYASEQEQTRSGILNLFPLLPGTPDNGGPDYQEVVVKDGSFVCHSCGREFGSRKQLNGHGPDSRCAKKKEVER